MTEPDLKSQLRNDYANVGFVYEGTAVRFRSVDDRDHILNDMRRRNSFYEADVLERIRDRMRGRAASAAIDVGAFIGTHCVYFAKFCGLHPVLAFEASATAYAVLEENIAANACDTVVVPVLRAIGATHGEAVVLMANPDNQGSTRLSLVAEHKSDSVIVSTIDAEVAASSEQIPSIALIKIDVEGAELLVLAGAKQTIKGHRPVLCVEVHNAWNLLKVINQLRSQGYWIVDCLGYSPTYILEVTSASWIRRTVVELLWLFRAAFLGGESKLALRASWYLRRLAQHLSAGRWDPPTRR